MNENFANHDDILLLSKELIRQNSGAYAYLNFKRTAEKLGFKVSRLFRGNDFETNRIAGRYEIWLYGDGFSCKEGKGNSIKEAVIDAMNSIHLMGRIISDRV